QHRGDLLGLKFGFRFRIGGRKFGAGCVGFEAGFQIGDVLLLPVRDGARVDAEPDLAAAFVGRQVGIDFLYFAEEEFGLFAVAAAGRFGRRRGGAAAFFAFFSRRRSGAAAAAGA